MVNAWRVVTEDLNRPTDGGEAEKWLLKREEATGILLESLAPTRSCCVFLRIRTPFEANQARSISTLDVVAT